MIAFVVLYNLFEEDLDNEKKKKEIERIIIRSVVRFVERRVLQTRRNEIIHSFSYDPSLTSSEIPIMIEIKLFDTSKKKSTLKNIAYDVQYKISELFQGKRKIRVIVQNINPDGATDL